MPEPIGPEGIPPDLIALFVQHASPGNYDETAPSPIGPLLRAATERGLAAVIPMIEARVLERLRPADMNLVVHVVRHEGPTSEVFAGPFTGDEAQAWIDANRTDKWTMCQVATLQRPAVVPERERLVHENPALAAQIREGIAQADRGDTTDLGSFAQHLDEGDDDD